MPIEIQQTWWHIEEIYFPTPARKIRQVMDIFTNEHQIIFPLIPQPFVGLKIVARNINDNEIAFLEVKNQSQGILLNLDNFDKAPDAPAGLTKYSDMKHLKIEIDYILIKTEYTKFEDKKIRDWLIPKRFSTQKVEGRIQPEFYLKLPEGWQMSKAKIEGDVTALKCIIKHDPDPSNIPSPNLDESYLLDLSEPFAELKEGKKTYHYLIDKDCYKELLTKLKDNPDCEFKFYYQSEKSPHIVAMEFLPLIFGVLSALIVICAADSLVSHSHFPFAGSIGTPILIAFLAYLYFYINLLNGSYELRFKRIFFVISCLTLVAVCITFIMPITAPSLC